MPTIKQLPAATAVGGTDLLPISQNGQTRSTTVNTLLNNTQPLLTLAQGTLVGRISTGLGTAESVNVGTGLSFESTTLVADATDHVGLTISTSLLSDDEVIVNSGSSPRRLAATKLRSLFTAGTGVQIDANGVISSSSASSGSSGVAGPKGDTGATGQAGQGFTFRAAWQANTPYSAYDVVTFNGQTYIAATAIPAAGSFSAAAWTLAAAQGATGATGASGLPGPAGPIVPATSAAIGGIKAGSGLTVTSDGTLSVSNVSLSSIAQGAASVGQLLGWGGTGWIPTTAGSGTSYTAAAPVAITANVVSLAQSGATNGQVLTWNGSAWVPQTPATGGVSLGSATPLGDGAASVGLAANASREDHRHPTDITRAPITAPVFAGSLTLPTWTTATRPPFPNIGMEGYATDTSRLEVYTSAGWVQFVRLGDIPAASGQLLAGTSIPGTTAAVSVGNGLSLVNGTLSATGTLSVVSLSGISIDGNVIVASPSSPYQMAASDRVVDVNKVSGAVTRIVLPTSPTLWVEYTIIDGKGDAGTNNIVVSGSSTTSINGSSTFTMNANNDAITLRAVNSTTWRIV